MQQFRPTLLLVILLLSFLVLLSRLFQLQVIEGRINRILADTNRIQKIKVEAPRGFLLDRHGQALAINEPIYEIEKPGEKPEIISREKALERQAEGNDKDLKIALKRRYLGGETFAHALGYLGEVTAEELTQGKRDLRGYVAGDWLGREGLEAKYEELLRGREGSELVEVDTMGEIIRRMGRILPSPGKTLTLALDKNLQETAKTAFDKVTEGKGKGVVVATNPQNGEILAFYSSPSFDPNLFLKTDDRRELVKIIQDEENLPLLNRVISGLYPPGSTFKIVTSTAALEEGKITASTLINDPGVIYNGSFKYANWYYTSYGKTEGEINVVKALARSTDTFFYKVGEMVGPEKINEWAKKFNLEQTTGIDLPGELSGFVATPEWKEKNRGEPWFLGNTYHLAIGQGDISLTPLGVNLMTAVVASGGKICTPRMLKIGAENTPYQADCQEIGVNQKYLEIIKKGMIGACETGGTAFPFFDFKPQVACKTGTAETGDGKNTHAWFTAFAPACAEASAGKACEPEIVVTVLVENGGEGSSVAAPIAKEVFKEYFKED
ncbi:MAG: penicillin-binding transpeptidase domain-containing protein [Patescibacteria group bacterium]|nr:penicillin-binding transpeptidase domain-containing protein [Patescibacteria group bacterium]